MLLNSPAFQLFSAMWALHTFLCRFALQPVSISFSLFLNYLTQTCMPVYDINHAYSSLANSKKYFLACLFLILSA